MIIPGSIRDFGDVFRFNRKLMVSNPQIYIGKRFLLLTVNKINHVFGIEGICFVNGELIQLLVINP